ncbi:magnesium transporter MRS2-4-like [Hibiscus syriacus]|uniref:Magnesium transporter MRS2-4-like n=1 Tax=Hibiscus syriacus TaxID=106335 RepID=A0A6A2YBH1_HIBSY|nr:magnesium transporter MRS2-4-like [Hibiscus syriacus]
MANSKCPTNIRNFMFSGKNPLLPPKSPFPLVAPANTDYIPNKVIGSRAVQKPREGNAHHQRTSSESIRMEEQPSWLDDLLNEPESPVRKGGHRRSSSDSFAYFDASNAPNMDFASQDDYRYKNMITAPSWASQDARLFSFYTDVSLVKQKIRAWDSSSGAVSHPNSLPSLRENTSLQSLGSSHAPQDVEGAPSTASEKQDSAEPASFDAKASSEKKDNCHTKSSSFDGDSKRAKQQFAQRSRVRKLQYIAELERNVQALQAKGSEVSAELEFLNQKNLILSMENKALKQWLEGLAQEQVIKYLEQEVLEREVSRLQVLYKQLQQHQNQQQQRQQLSSSHRHTSSRDLKSEFTNLSLSHKDANSARDPVTGSLRI